MAQEYDNTNSILVTKNDKKGNDKAPDYRITLDVNGSPFTGGLWLRSSDKFASDINPKGSFMSGKVEPKRVNGDSLSVPAKTSKASDQMDDLESDIPF
jgi:hypothetical protein